MPRGRNFRLSRGVTRVSPRQDGMIYEPQFLARGQRQELLQWLETLHPLWEERFSEGNPPPAGQRQRSLLRPVYWLGNWQFACLDYYRPPAGIRDRCVRAEPFP